MPWIFTFAPTKPRGSVHDDMFAGLAGRGHGKLLHARLQQQIPASHF
jgi:hypothetical protein